MSGYSIQRLQKLIEQKRFVVKNYFTLDGKYYMIELVGYDDAVSLVIVLDQEVTPIESAGLSSEYELNEKDVTTFAPTNGLSEFDMRSKYKEIDHISKVLQDEDQLAEVYAKPISLSGAEDKTRVRFSSAVSQLNRFRLCFPNIPYKVCIFDNDCASVLVDSTHTRCFYIREFRNTRRKLFITTTLDNFYETNDMGADVNKVLHQFYSVLDDSQQHETDKIQRMIDSKKNFTAQSRKIMVEKKRLQTLIQTHQKQHQTLTDQIFAALKKRKDALLKAGTHERSNIETHYNSEIADLEDKRRMKVEEIIEARKDLDEITLVVDTVFFENMVRLTQLEASYRVLEKLKVK